ncbi:MAG: glycosyltransferase family 4 protein [Lentisphaerae bacterium]|nr:glycosyltransferase family 4 protein [Lentisphaerota bacterium]
MKIGISLLNYRPGSVGGIETYIEKLVEHFAGAQWGHELSFIAGPEVAALLPEDAGRQTMALSSRGAIAARCLEAFTPWRARRIAKEIDTAGYDVVFFPQQSIFPLEIKTPAVLTVVDLQHRHHPEHYALFDRCFRRAIYPPSLRRSTKIIAISDVTKTDLVETCGVAPDKIDVVHMGFDGHGTEPPSTTGQRLVDAPYFYYPAATFPHKGHADLLRCFAHLKASSGSAVKLVFSGMQTPLWKRLARQIRHLGLEGEVYHMGFVSYSEVIALYRGAEAVLFPTRFEGFGMPVLEAVRYGKPIFCSNLPIFDELGVPRQNQIDFSEERALEGIMERLTPTVLLIEPITWEACAKKTLQVVAAACRRG